MEVNKVAKQNIDFPRITPRRLPYTAWLETPNGKKMRKHY